MLQPSCGPGSCTLPTWGQGGTYLAGVSLLRFKLTRPLTTMGFWHSFRVSGPRLGGGRGWGGGLMTSTRPSSSTTDHRRHRPRRRKQHHHQHHDVPVQCSEAAMDGAESAGRLEEQGLQEVTKRRHKKGCLQKFASPSYKYTAKTSVLWLRQAKAW